MIFNVRNLNTSLWRTEYYVETFTDVQELVCLTGPEKAFEGFSWMAVRQWLHSDPDDADTPPHLTRLHLHGKKKIQIHSTAVNYWLDSDSQISEEAIWRKTLVS